MNDEKSISKLCSINFPMLAIALFDFSHAVVAEGLGFFAIYQISVSTFDDVCFDNEKGKYVLDRKLGRLFAW